MARAAGGHSFLDIKELRHRVADARTFQTQEMISMTTAIDAQALADLLDDLMAWLRANPDADLNDFAEQHNCSVEDVSDAWNTYFSADFSRDYKFDNDINYNPGPPPHGNPEALKSYLVNEVNTYQQYTTNIEDNSFNQQIIAGGDVDQDIDIDNSDNIADDGGVVVRDSSLDDSDVVTGDRNAVESEDVLTGEVGSPDDDGGQGANNINFGRGEVTNTQQAADVDVDNSGDTTSGDTGSADGEGGDANSSVASEADGGDGGDGGDVEGGLIGIGVLNDGGDGGDATSAATSTSTGGAGTGGKSGDSGNATSDNDAIVTFS